MKAALTDGRGCVPSHEEPLTLPISLKGGAGFTMLPDGSMGIVDELGHCFYYLDAKGNLLWQFPEKEASGNVLRYPVDVTWRKNRFWITDRYHHRILCLDDQGQNVREWGSYGSDPSQFMEPFGVSVNDQGQIWVADSGNGRIKAFDEQGSLIQCSGESGPGGEYYTSDFFQEQAVFRKWKNKQTRFYTLESAFYQSGFHLGTLERPQGIACLDNDSIVVADLAGRIQVLGREGQLINSFFPLPWCQWISVWKGFWVASRAMDTHLFTAGEAGKLKKFLNCGHEVGKFQFESDTSGIYHSPWEKQFYRVSW